MIDLEALSTRLGGNESIVKKILDIFVMQYGQTPSVFETAVASGDTEAIYQQAHSIKGALANMCAEEDAAIAEEIERIAKGGEMPPQSLVENMEQRIRDINQQIERAGQ
jgi:HPt (histidine-containing phosphotransfer) domain-containing protein